MSLDEPLGRTVVIALPLTVGNIAGLGFDVLQD